MTGISFATAPVLRTDANEIGSRLPSVSIASPGNPLSPRHRQTTVISVCNFLSKGWEVSILGLLAFLQQKYKLPIYDVGLLSTAFIVSQIGISFFAGRIAHAVHSRNVIFMAIIASGMAWLTLFFAGHLPALYAAYALAGMSSGLFEPIGNSLIAKLSPANSRGKSMGNFAAYGDMGRIAMVAITTALAGSFGVTHASGLLFITSVAALLLAAAYLPPVAGAEDPQGEQGRLALRDLFKNINFRYATAAGIADSFSSASLYIFIPFLLTAKGIALDDTLYFNVIFFAGYMTGRLVLGRIADRHGAPRTLMISEVLMAALILLLTFATGIGWILAVLFVLGIFTRGTSPIIRAMVADSLDPGVSFHDAFSAYSVASRGSSALCRPAYGFIAAYAGIAPVFYVASAVSLLTLYPAARYNAKHVPLTPGFIEVPPAT